MRPPPSLNPERTVAGQGRLKIGASSVACVLISPISSWREVDQSPRKSSERVCTRTCWRPSRYSAVASSTMSRSIWTATGPLAFLSFGLKASIHSRLSENVALRATSSVM